MILTRAIIVVYFILTFSPSIRADCLACWELKFVKITLANDKVIEGYIKWKEVWFKKNVSMEYEISSFHEKYIFTMEKEKWDNLIIYHEIIKLGDHLPFKGIVVNISSLDTFNISDIYNIKTISLEEEVISGAGEIITYNDETIKLLENIPECWFKDQGTVSETYFLSYNQTIDKSRLIEISKISDYWLQRKSLEKEGVIIFMDSFD